jgi:ketosteroid isomerase-like protein
MPAPEADIAPLFRDDEMWAVLAQALSPVIASGFECVNPGSPGEQTYSGMEGFRTFWLDWLAPWASYRAEVQEAVDLGERVLVLAENFGCLHGSMREVKVSAASIYTFRDGRIARYEGYLDRAEALRAAGLDS